MCDVDEGIALTELVQSCCNFATDLSVYFPIVIGEYLVGHLSCV